MLINWHPTVTQWSYCLTLTADRLTNSFLFSRTIGRYMKLTNDHNKFILSFLSRHIPEFVAYNK